MKQKPKILWLSDSPTTMTGYRNQSFNIVNRLSKYYDFHWQAHNYIGQDIMPGMTFKDGTKCNFTIYGNGTKPYSQDLIVPRIRELKPDLFVTLLDTFMLFPWVTQLDFAPAQSLFYFPSDGENSLPLGCEQVLAKFNHRVAMARFGQEQIKKQHNLNSVHIPHAVDSKLFKPLDAKTRNSLRKDTVVYMFSNNQFIGVKGALNDKFVIGVVARNQGRKMLDRTFKAMAVIKEKIPNAVLYMHTDPFDSAGVFNVQQIIKDYNLENKVFFSGMNFFRAFSDNEMNNVYNLMDVFFLSTSGEGFGIPIVEAMSAGVPPIVTDYTTTNQLIMQDGQCGLPIKMDTTILGNWNVERGVMNIEDAANCAYTLYSDKKLKDKLAKVGRAKVLKIYDWDVVIKQWKKLFDEIIKNK